MRQRVRVAVAAALAAVTLAGCSSATSGTASPAGVAGSSAPSGPPSTGAGPSSGTGPSTPPSTVAPQGPGPGAVSSACALITGPEVSAAFGVGGVKAKEAPPRVGQASNAYSCNYTGGGLIVVLQIVVVRSKLRPGEARDRVRRSLGGANGKGVTPVPGLGDAAATFTFTKGATTFDGVTATGNTDTGALGLVAVTVHRSNGARALVRLARGAFTKVT